MFYNLHKFLVNLDLKFVRDTLTAQFDHDTLTAQAEGGGNASTSDMYYPFGRGGLTYVRETAGGGLRSGVGVKSGRSGVARKGSQVTTPSPPHHSGDSGATISPTRNHTIAQPYLPAPNPALEQLSYTALRVTTGVVNVMGMANGACRRSRGPRNC